MAKNTEVNMNSWKSKEEFYKFHKWTPFNPKCVQNIAIELFAVSTEDLSNQDRVKVYTNTIERLKEKARLCPDKKYRMKLINQMRTNIRTRQELIDRQKGSKAWFKDNSRKTYGYLWAVGNSGVNPNVARCEFERLLK